MIVPWLRHIRETVIALGQHAMWETPESACPAIPRKELVNCFRQYKLMSLQASPSLGRLTLEFLQVKETYSKASFLDAIQPPLARKLFTQFRHRTFPLLESMSKWVQEQVDQCPACNSYAESEIHVLFFLPRV